MIDIEKVRQDFPILHQEVNGKKLVYFDNAATTQKPQVVLDALAHYYGSYNSNIHRGIHYLAEKATSAFEETRKSLATFINAPSHEQIIFTYGTTDGINLIANTFGTQNIKEGDEVIISTMEHHSNIVPWQMLCERSGANLKIIPVSDSGELDLESFKQMLSAKTKLVSVVHVSNSLGTINPVKEIIQLAHKVGARVLIDGAQAMTHIDVDVQDLDVDFYVFSAHKLFGPTGMGVMYGKREILDSMPPWRGGGEMIKEVTFEKTTYNELPYKFEAGTPNIADVIAVKNALDYINKLGKKNIRSYEDELLAYATEKLLEIEGLEIVGTAKEKVSVISFKIAGIHPQDIGIMLDQQGIAIRTGHHCTQPLMQRYEIPGTARVSFSVYNTKEEVDRLVEGIKKIKKLLL